MKTKPVGGSVLRFVLWVIVAMLVIAYVAVLVAGRY
jgi:hypothetical protein